MSIKDYFGDWMKVIDQEELERVTRIIGSIYNTHPICPDINDIFRAFKLCPYNNLKVVMLGQDPYPQRGVATGILFGNKPDVLEDKLSPSLKIVKEACINYEVPHNSIIFDQTLESWAKQGVLMINSALTVELNKIGSHVMLWRYFISKMLSNLSLNNTGIIYVLFGEQANTFKPYISETNNVVIKEKHPAFYARVGKRMPSDVFIRINKELVERYGEGIKWYEEY